MMLRLLVKTFQRLLHVRATVTLVVRGRPSWGTSSRQGTLAPSRLQSVLVGKAVTHPESVHIVTRTI